MNMSMIVDMVELQTSLTIVLDASQWKELDDIGYYLEFLGHNTFKVSKEKL